jgi:hypothetical protein
MAQLETAQTINQETQQGLSICLLKFLTNSIHNLTAKKNQHDLKMCIAFLSADSLTFNSLMKEHDSKVAEIQFFFTGYVLTF